MSQTPGSRIGAGRHSVQLAATVVGAAFLLVGILGVLLGRGRAVDHV